MNESGTGRPSDREIQILKKALVTLREEAGRSLADKTSTGVLRFEALARRFNELLARARSLLPSEEQLAHFKEVTPRRTGLIGAMEVGAEVITEVQLQCQELLDLLEVEVPVPPNVPRQLIQVTQSVNQEVITSMEQLTKAVQQSSIQSEQKSDLEAWIRQFSAELQKEKPSPNALKRLLEHVTSVGKEFVVPLLFEVLRNWDKLFR